MSTDSHSTRRPPHPKRCVARQRNAVDMRGASGHHPPRRPGATPASVLSSHVTQQHIGATMEFMIIGRDGTDAGAADRRLAVRAQHLDCFDEFSRSGFFKYGCAILDDKQQMVGSLIICEFASRDELEQQWLSNEPYVVGDVWRNIEITQIRSRIPAKERPAPFPAA